MSTIFAKLSTAKTILFGPVLDSAGAEYTLAVVGDVKISKNNGTPGALNASATLTHKEVGNYELVLTTSDISEVGMLTITLSKTTYIAPPVRLQVLAANVYDSLFAAAGTDYLDVSAVQFAGQTITCAAGVTISPYVGNATAALSVSAAGRVDVGLWLGSACATPTQAGVPEVDLTFINGVAASGSSTIDANVTSWNSVALATTNPLPNAAAGASNGLLISGSNSGTTTLGALTVTGACTHGSTVLGNTTMGTLTQTGAVAWGATTYASMAVTGELTVSNGIVVTCSTDSKSAIKATGGATAGIGMEVVGNGSGSGMTIAGGATGPSLYLYSALSDGLRISAGADGIDIDAGNGAGIDIVGATYGVTITGGSSTGLYVTGTDAMVLYSAAGEGLQTSTLKVTGLTTYTGNVLHSGTTTYVGAFTTTGAVVTGTVDNTGFTPTTVAFEASNITTAAASHYVGRVIVFTSGTLLGQACTITAYSLVGGRGHFTVSTLTSAPANAVTFNIY